MTETHFYDAFRNTSSIFLFLRRNEKHDFIPSVKILAEQFRYKNIPRKKLVKVPNISYNGVVIIQMS